jgi:hypothetical protein
MDNYFGTTNEETRARIRTYLKGRTQQPEVQNEILDILSDVLLQLDVLKIRTAKL